jgi:hypothetical protein
MPAGSRPHWRRPGDAVDATSTPVSLTAMLDETVKTLAQDNNFATLTTLLPTGHPATEARAHIDKLSENYTGGSYANPIQSERVIVKIAPIRQRAQ